MLWAALHDRPGSWAWQKRHRSATTLRPRRLPASYVYDGAFARGYQRAAPSRKAENPGSGKHDQRPQRLRRIDVMRSDFGEAQYKARTAIERSFGHAGSVGGGLGPLPAGVRTWVWAKLLIHAVRILMK
jgi:hypothetical protein